MARVILQVLDSLGVGASLDAPLYGDEGANTLAHIMEACAAGQADRTGCRQGDLHIPHLTRLGLIHALVASSGLVFPGFAALPLPQNYYGYAVEKSKGKDTPSGHWEMAGLVVDFDWGIFPDEVPCFPKTLIEALIERANLPGILAQKRASGTDVIEEFGRQHLQTLKPIVYASADSVLQIAAHEEHFGLSRLYELCALARELVDEYAIGRVIARPFIGKPGAFLRTANRKDYTTPPPQMTLLDDLKAANHEVIAIGKISDIFADQGVTQTIKAADNMALFDATLLAMKDAPDGALIFTNYVDFDSMFGHRRDLVGYAKALEEFDARIPQLEALLKADDLVVFAADHGCDPSFPGSDHTREHIPILAFGHQLSGQFIGRRDSFADIGQSIASFLASGPLPSGISFLKRNLSAAAKIDV